MNAPPKVIFPSYDDSSFKTTPLPRVHNITCDQYKSADAVDTGHESDGDGEIDNEMDDEDMEPSWKLSDAEQFLSDDDMEVEPSEEDFKSPLLTRKNNLWSLVHVFLNFSKDAQNVGMLSSSRRTKLLVLCYWLNCLATVAVQKHGNLNQL